LGIDTVKQAELFAMIREHYDIPRKENLSLKDYPTIRHCIKFVMDETGIKLEARGERIEDRQVTGLKSQVSSPSTLYPIPSSYPKRHIRHVPAPAPMPVQDELVKKLSSKRPVVIFSDDPELTKSFRFELNKLRIDSFVFTTIKSKTKDSFVVDWSDIEGVERSIADFAGAHGDVQGVFYLLGTAPKKLDRNTNASADIKRWAMPLFLAAKHFNASLNKMEEGYSTFFVTATKVDGAFGYKTSEAYDPVYGAINGINLCLRKEIDKSIVKFLDFAPDSKPEAVAHKTFYELLYADKRAMISYDSNKRFTIMSKPALLETSAENLDLRGKKIVLTGGGRGLGAKFAEITARRYRPVIIILDIITLNENSGEWASMSEEELKNFKTAVLWEELKRKTEKPTPAMLEREFTKIKDSALLYKTIENLKSCGAKAHYYYCDVNNREIFNSVIEAIKKEHGRVDGLVHFAGLERSKLIVDKTLDEFFAVFNTKADSAINFWKSGVVKDNGFFVMISSIAGKYGNLGQSDYAAASDYISKFAISLSNAGIRALAVDMTGYAEIGMAMRPGVEAFLKSQRLEFLYPDEGMNALLDEIVYGKIPEIVLSASLGSLDWDKQLEFNPDFPETRSAEFHFSGKVIKEAKGLESASLKTFSLETDPYMNDHSINGTPYVPGVMGIETFAETARVFTGKTPKSLGDIHFYMPIKLLKNNPLEVRIICVSRHGKPEMKMESNFINAKGIKLGSTRTHFSARVQDAPESSWNPDEKPAVPKTKKFKVTADTIYKTYFHGPSFQVLEGILSIKKEEVLAVYKKPSAPLWETANPELLFHPMIIEAAFQTCGYRDIYFEKKMTLPDALGHIIIHNFSQPPETLYIHAVYKGQDPSGKSLYDAFVFDADGNIWLELQDYAMIPTQI
ncbi:MAG: SDR family NAD(P)-dependent oxidoreductase, partial [Elusimicrobia bacterium]|nr:SDR family NAD(P)-dependent oxidoreductase [Elusimicrobiota bacterium]